MLYRQQTLETPHGTVETPVLFPVRNIGKRSTDNTPQYTDAVPDLQTAMVNTRAIRQRESQWHRLLDGSTIRGEMGASPDTVVFADSGGYGFQTDEVDTTPERILEAQQELDADILGTVDRPLSRNNRDAENQHRISESTEYALAASDHHDGEELLFASVHGLDPETVRNNINYLENHGDFDGYALGSLVPVRTDYEKVIRLVLAARRTTEKHLHVYGLGGLVYQPLLLYLGVDSFDSTAFIRSAANRNYLIPGFGGQELSTVTDLAYLPCSCPVCCDTPLSELREDRDALTKHNLWALTIELRRFRYMVTAGKDIETYLDLRFQGNEVTQRAYQAAKQQVRRFV
ncbi:tRNA-guanine transglycosylase [Natronococcus sp. A-GB1]|uniref:tRNA-guanine transglycosylase n=1 Tax=Natronococcus sp. A-GB1 TaxID=3037648 RepID=UPI00241FA25C|nr:tRNA-guanine transglycosylase [Natronococcus sp. A-GB1]MDG5761338.1 tRNA-guanine transglycosylase [Natronococcus sp. A-GB1]